ncbi:MAG: hypothetical protein O3B09_00555 [Proteobacteria bacterium]|nr:hypothetical protein [Pseudomonadota bacterium]
MPETWEWGMRPRPRFGVNNLPEANDDYGKGFKAGCSASFGSLGKGLISDFTKLELNPAMLANSPDYSEGWTDGMEHCTYIFDHDVI